jgi:hypothetical protein
MRRSDSESSGEDVGLVATDRVLWVEAIPDELVIRDHRLCAERELHETMLLRGIGPI